MEVRRSKYYVTLFVNYFSTLCAEMGRRFSLLPDRAGPFMKGQERRMSSLDVIPVSREVRINVKSGRKGILLAPDRKLDGHKELRKLKKVYFNIPQGNKEWWRFEAIDPRSSFVQRWLMFMLFPLGYEVWAFPYRLALGVPSLSTQMQLTVTDFVCDMFFLMDMVVSLCTLLPKAPGREEPVTSFLGIARHYFRSTFLRQLLPSFPYWVATFLVTNHLQEYSVCGLVTASKELYLNWSCIIQNQDWEVILWWVTSFVRVLPRLVRLVVDFKSMESNLVGRLMQSSVAVRADANGLLPRRKSPSENSR
jgi:hypothetical protein